jgi:hypothetical protein
VDDHDSSEEESDDMGLGSLCFSSHHLQWLTFFILDSLIDDQAHELDEGIPQQCLSWRGLSNREEGLDEFLAGILDCSCNAMGGVYAAGNNTKDADHTISSVNDVGIFPTSYDYPLWWVRCRVSPTVVR